MSKKFAQKHNLFQINITFAAQKRKDARVIEWTGLEIRRTVLPYRGFESHSFRKTAPKRWYVNELSKKPKILADKIRTKQL